MPSVRAMVSGDKAQVLLLNAGARPHVAPLDDAELTRLCSLSDAHLVAAAGDVVVGYTLNFADDAAYDGEEFLVFGSLIARPFVYIDQVVVLSSVRGTGVGRILYTALEHTALIRGAHSLCCEVNTDPPNPGSLAFHHRLGFSAIKAIATQDGRHVNLLEKRITGV